jgi:hypothetical protein
VIVLRQDFHARDDAPAPISAEPASEKTTERIIPTEIVICVKSNADADDEVLIGEWDPATDDVRNPLRIPHGDFQRLFSLRDGITAESLSERRDDVRETYHKLSDRTPSPPLPFGEFRASGDYDAFVLGAVVEKL